MDGAIYFALARMSRHFDVKVKRTSKGAPPTSQAPASSRSILSPFLAVFCYLASLMPALLLLFFLVFSACHFSAAQSPDRPPPSLIIVGVHLVTLDPRLPNATAVAIAGERIVAVGDDTSILRLAAPSTRVIHASGRVVLPGLTDAHAHLVSLGIEADELDLRGVASEAEVGRRLAAYAKSHPTGWVAGHAWDQNLWSPAQFPDARTLDAAAPGRAVVLSRIDGHALWASQAALAAGGVTRETADPAGGRILRRSDGEPTGVLVDRAMALVEKAIPDDPDDSAIERAILFASDRCLRVGLTGVHDMGTSAHAAAVMQKLAREGRLPIRVYAYFRRSDFDRLIASPPERGLYFRTQGVKLFADGALGSRGAALLEPYSDDPRNVGLVLGSKSDIASIARRANGAGYQVATHAIGDRAVRDTLDAYEEAIGRDASLRDSPVRSEQAKTANSDASRSPRFRVEHAQVVAPGDRKRFAALGVVASMQPTHATSDAPWAPARLGADRIGTAYAWRSLLDADAHVAFGSDFPIELPSPILGLYAAIARKNADGKPSDGFVPRERITFEEAVRAYTEGAAYAAQAESDRGTIAPGKLADFTIIDLTSEQVNAIEPLRTASVAYTIVGGKVRYSNNHR